MIEVYHVSAQPEDWANGRVFQIYSWAESEAHRIGGCVTAVRYTFDDSELVIDCREEEGMWYANDPFDGDNTIDISTH